MSRFLHTLSFSGNASSLFEAVCRYFHEKGFHVEEADAVELRLHAEKDRGILSSLFGLGTMHVFVSFPQSGSMQVRLSHPAPSLIEDLQRIADELPAPAAQAPDAAGRQGPMIVVREIVRIPCRFCGSLVENTQRRCPYCGGEPR